MALDAATLGLGVALESTTIASQHMADGKLVPVFGWEPKIDVDAHFVVYLEKHAKRPSVAAFLHWLDTQTAQQES